MVRYVLLRQNLGSQLAQRCCDPARAPRGAGLCASDSEPRQGRWAEKAVSNPVYLKTSGLFWSRFGGRVYWISGEKL
jgi:hypothetical protein